MKRAAWSVAFFAVLAAWGAAWVVVATSPLIDALPTWFWLILLTVSAVPLEPLYRRSVPPSSPLAGGRHRGRFRDGGER